MRVTNRMMANNYLRDMNRNMKNLDTINNQLATGKEINKVSDDPFKAARSMQLTTDINTNEQYNTNIKDTINWLDTTDDALYQATNVMQRLRELMVSSGNAAYGSDESKSINEEIKERVSELTQVLNTNFDGKYIFGGTKVSSKPLDAKKDAVTGNYEMMFVDQDGNKLDPNSSDTYTQNKIDNINGSLNVEISQSVTMKCNVNAMEILKFKNENGESIDVMKLLSDVQNNLSSENSVDRSKVTNENLGVLDDVITNILKIRSEVGAKQNRMESAQSKNEDENLNMTTILSKTEDIDFTEKTIEFNMAQTTYTAALQVNAQVLPKTILDYL
ncbi:flagellar hook-associated protein FlgL [Clostridium sp. SHJSY1]|uniref:flagellar hook-associated protein FlgL n=1 Tax=Clostridium sp. SHJSY1 TaxID=2942483 RepID=UPI002875D602|nr:flagellar hook-associated protein FlgL [Clostridium sp. SHJSY1]MDS0524123.1 flagellar hook-associated protein FlgL [Clostridium sp. SHJSY1]